jgi:hypothetical protein
MKILMQCPNCRKTSIIQSDLSLNSRRLKELFKESGSICIDCKNNGLGQIPLKVKNFDMEQKSETVSNPDDVHAPTKLDPKDFDPEKIEQLKNRALEKIEGS